MVSAGQLRDHRRELERAIAFYRKHHPAAPVLVELQARLDDVLAEQEQPAAPAPCPATPPHA